MDCSKKAGGKAAQLSLGDRERKSYGQWLQDIGSDNRVVAGKTIQDPTRIVKQILIHEAKDVAGTVPNHGFRPLDLSWRFEDAKNKVAVAGEIREAVLVARVAFRNASLEAATTDDAQPLPTKLWLGDLPAPEKTRPPLQGQIYQDTFVRVLLPVRPVRCRGIEESLQNDRNPRPDQEVRRTVRPRSADAQARAQATSTASSAPTAPARRRPCASSPRCSTRPGARPPCAATRSTTAPRRSAASIGYMPDFFGVYDDMKVIEYLEFFAAAYRIKGPERRKKCDQVLELVDLGYKRDALVTSLSRGMTQRLGLARVLLHEPQVLLLDEPASGLDPRARIEMRGLLKELRNMGKTIMVSSHILPELADICNKIGIIERGKLLFDGDVRDGHPAGAASTPS